MRQVSLLIFRKRKKRRTAIRTTVSNQFPYNDMYSFYWTKVEGVFFICYSFDTKQKRIYNMTIESIIAVQESPK
jgi:hypothetical protein